MRVHMRIILTADIHGNLPALEAVLEHGYGQGGNRLWDLGDQVGYGAFPDEVVSLIARSANRAVIGNYDRKVLKIEKKSQKWRDKKNPVKLFAFEWAHSQLSRRNRRRLGNLPKTCEFELEGYRINLSHKGPRIDKKPLKPGRGRKKFARAANDDDRDIYVFGHTHIPYARKVENTWFINPGSVGRPDDGDRRASYAMLILENGTASVHHYRITYDVERAVQKAQECKLPEEFARMLLEGRSLDDLEKH